MSIRYFRKGIITSSHALSKSIHVSYSKWSFGIAYESYNWLEIERSSSAV